MRLLLGRCQTPEHVSAFLDELDQPVAGPLDDLARMSLTQMVRKSRDPWRDLAAFSLTRDDSDGRGREGCLQSGAGSDTPVAHGGFRPTQPGTGDDGSHISDVVSSFLRASLDRVPTRSRHTGSIVCLLRR